ncbi:MAG: hypothetical protein ACREQY_24385, partial [Candidatus Binatia bacterium]
DTPNPQGERWCSRCGLSLSAAPREVAVDTAAETRLPDLAQEPELPAEVDDTPREPAARPPRHPSPPAGESHRSFLGEMPKIVGRVISIDPETREPPDLEWPRVVHSVILLLEFLVAPLIALWFFLTVLGPLSIILALIGLVVLFRLIHPLSLLAFLGIFDRLTPFGRRASDEHLPVQHFRVREVEGGAPVLVRRKGYLRYGNVALGEPVAVWGSFHGGVLFLRRAQNVENGAVVALRGAPAWLPLLVNLTILVFLLGVFQEPLSSLFETLSHLGAPSGSPR